MTLDDFTIGLDFACNGRQYRCTDIGTRTIVAIRTDAVDVGSTVPMVPDTLEEAQAEGWFDGPPYSVQEIVFDEEAIACSTLGS